MSMLKRLFRRDSQHRPHAGATIVATSIDNLASQGVKTLADGSGAFYHFSTSPSEFYEIAYGVPGGLNMDRGGIGQFRESKFNFGCVFDGVTAGGKVNAYAAQAFTDYTLTAIPQRIEQLSDPEQLAPALEDIFTQACGFNNNPGGDHNAEGGSATGVVAMGIQGPLGLQVVGGWLGDSACIVVDPVHGVTLLTHFTRRTDSAKDTGGQLSMSFGINGTIRTFQYSVSPESLVILCTDGLMDNIVQAQISDIIEIIITSPLFDTVPHLPCTCEDASRSSRSQLPTKDYILQVEQGVLSSAPERRAERRHVRRASIRAIDCGVVCTRLINYLDWVTARIQARESQYYSLQAQLERLHRAGEASSEHAQLLDEQMRQMRQQRKDSPISGKTDDCMVLAMRLLSPSASTS